MAITKKQFDVLVLLESKDVQLSQREIAKETDISVGTVNKLLSELSEQGFVSGGAITDKGR